jgi:predicted GNAT family acetyltransferase
MPWTLTSDPEVYAERVWDLLAAEPMRNTVALTVLEMARRGHRWSPQPMLFGWYEENGAVAGAIFHTPPFELGLGIVPEAASEPLVQALRADGHAVHGVNGDAASAERFAAAWSAATGERAETSLALCLHELGELTAPDPPPAGSARPAGEDDVALAVRWYEAFRDETGAPGGGDAAAMVRERVTDRRLWLWEGEDGTPVALAGRTAASARVARIAPVYTPPEHRRRGYGAAVTAACTADALDRGDDSVVLFSDVADASATAIYRRLGFRPVAEQRVVLFTPAE